MTNLCPPDKPTKDLQEGIITEFSLFLADRDEILAYIMELGEKMPSIPNTLKVDNNVVYGCMSKVWISYLIHNDRILYQGDSEAAITKGLLSLLIRVLSNQTLTDVITADLYFFDKIGIPEILSHQRSIGLANMIKKMKAIATSEILERKKLDTKSPNP